VTEAGELVLPFVVRIERDTPPRHTDALEAAAVGVLRILTAERPEWAGAIAAWDGQRIRKVVRRARGAAWEGARELEGLDVRRGTAELRVYPPIPVDGWPEQLARLQVGGTNLADPEAPAPPNPHAPVILLSPHAEMSTGKAMAQAAHAAQLGWRSLPTDRRTAWRHAAFAIAVRDAAVDEWGAALERGGIVVHDGGFTEVAPGTATAAFLDAGQWPPVSE
jgi:peptidyl-tRNA hydrolase